MRVLFLLFASAFFMLTVYAQRQFNQYTCQVSHKQSEVGFYLNMDEIKEVEVGEWKVEAGIKRVGNEVEVSLERAVDVLGASYQKAARQLYPVNARRLPVELVHAFGGKTDVFGMVCFPRDP